MRRVVSNDEVPHLWAHQTQDEAKNGNGSLYFNGRTIYSYGSHFPISTIHDGPNGERVYFVTTRKYSITTTGHVSRVRNAIPRTATVFYVQNPWLTPVEQAREYRDEIRKAERELPEAKNKRSLAKRISALEQLAASANDFAEFFQLPDRFTVRTDVEAIKAEVAEKVRQYEERLARERERYQREQKKRVQRWLKEHASEIAQWKIGAIDYIPGLSSTAPVTYLRVIAFEVETSRGAHFPARHAARGLKLIEAVRKAKRTWKRNGETCRLGHYQIDQIDPNGDVHAGCHFVTYQEIASIKSQLLEVAATDPINEEV